MLDAGVVSKIAKRDVFIYQIFRAMVFNDRMYV